MLTRDSNILKYTDLPLETPTLLYLDKNKKSSILIHHLPTNLVESTRHNFDKMFLYHPDQRGVVMSRVNIYPRLPTKNIEVPCNRWHQSYLNTPKYIPEHNTTYMFSGINPSPQPDLPVEFKELLDWMNLDKPIKYNQVVANWYETGQDYIPFHSDYEYNSVPDTSIAVVNITTEADDCSNCNDVHRKFILKAKSPDACYSKIEIPLYHGRIIEMIGDTQKLYRHGVPKINTSKPRISLSFRAFL